MTTPLTRRDRLIRLRDRLERRLTKRDLPDREFAAMSREYRAVLAELESIPNMKQVSAADEIAERRRRRQANAKRASRTQGA